MKTYSAGTTPLEVIEQSLPHKYPMELNRSDMIKLLEVLWHRFEFGEPDGNEGEDSIQSWCLSMRSSILSTIDIEEV